jgi:hypothetical protein
LGVTRYLGCVTPGSGWYYDFATSFEPGFMARFTLFVATVPILMRVLLYGQTVSSSIQGIITDPNRSDGRGDRRGDLQAD